MKLIPKLIPEAKRWYRMFSLQSMSISVALLGSWGALPDDLKAVIPIEWVIVIAITILVLGMFGRLIPQKKVHE